jgi:SulP family sulfate permease
MYFLESGQVTAERVCADGSIVRLRRMGPGTVVGEIGLYLGGEATASVVTNRPSTIHYLSLENLRHMEETAPGSASALHRYLAQLLSECLS